MFGGKGDEGAGLGGGRGEGFVDDDVLAGAEGGGGQRDVGVVGGGDDDEVEGGVGEGFFRGAKDAGRWVGFRGGGAGALDDGSELEPRNGGDEGAVEDFATEAIADDGGADGVRHGEMVIVRIPGGSGNAHLILRDVGIRRGIFGAKWGCGKIFGISVGIFAYIGVGLASVVRNP